MKVTTANWTFYLQTKEDKRYMLPLFCFVRNQFVEIFGEEVLNSEECEVFNAPAASCPMLITNTVSIRIRTSVPSLQIWNQYIYQLSHEMTHYVIRQYKPDKRVIIKWFEETLCEAMSLYILKRDKEHWNLCTLSALNADYGAKMLDYCKNVYQKTSDSVLKQCHNLSDLETVENTCEENRDARSLVRNYLFDTFCEYPDCISAFVYYPLYMCGNLQIDFTKWKENDACPLIPKLENIQPVLFS